MDFLNTIRDYNYFIFKVDIVNLFSFYCLMKVSYENIHLPTIMWCMYKEIYYYPSDWPSIPGDRVTNK